jgi:hypothetical protein
LLNPRPSESGAINCRVGTDLDIVVDLNDTELLNFFLPSVDHFKTETVRSDNGTTVNDHARANAASLPDCYARINQARSANHSLMPNV